MSPAIALAVLAAVGMGSGDFLAGVLGRRDSTPAGMLTVFLLMAASAIPLAVVIQGSPTGTGLAWGATWGVIAPAAFYALIKGVAHGRVIVVIPVSGFTAATIPVAVDVLTGGRPEGLVWFGVTLGVVAVILLGMAPGREGERSVAWSLSMGAIGGGFTGVGYILLDHAAEIGLWLIGWGSLSAAAVTAIVLVVGRQSPLTPRRALGPAAGIAVLFVIAIGAATAAFERSSLTAVAIVISQYPAATLILAALIWKQRPRPVQYLGVAMTLAAVAAIAVA